jgi:S1-C subfamily serine protease
LPRKSDGSRKTIAILLLIIVALGSLALYYSPLIQGTRTKNLDPVQIYANSSHSVVTVRGVTPEFTLTDSGPSTTLVTVLGTGFVVTYNSSYYIVTNFHVVDGLVNATVTFSNGDSYRAKVIGSDAYSDLAIVSIAASTGAYYPLCLGSSSTLKVGESVVAIGNPYGLSNTITVGIVSQVGRSLRTDTSGGYAIANTIQFSAAINPGNSGGPLINSDGVVVGMTTAIVSDSQGLGFAIPSDTISREFPLLVKDGKYDKHPYLGVQLADMNYQLAQAMRTNLTWGVLIENAVPGGPASKSGLRGGTQNVTIEQQRYLIGGDIIVSLDGNKVVNYDALSAYLEERAAPGQTIQVEIMRSGTHMTIPVQLGTRPPIS